MSFSLFWKLAMVALVVGTIFFLSYIYPNRLLNGDAELFLQNTCGTGSILTLPTRCWKGP